MVSTDCTILAAESPADLVRSITTLLQTIDQPTNGWDLGISFVICTATVVCVLYIAKTILEALKHYYAYTADSKEKANREDIEKLKQIVGIPKDDDNTFAASIRDFKKDIAQINKDIDNLKESIDSGKK